MTLEAIGTGYKITRERVRQIEEEALKRLSKEDKLGEVRPLLEAVEKHLEHNGGVMAEQHLFTTLVDERQRSHLAFLLKIADKTNHFPEDDHFHCRWAVNPAVAASAEKVMTGVTRALDEDKTPYSYNSLVAMVSQKAKETVGQEPMPHVVDAFIATSKLIHQNPYGEYGLVSWPIINPRSVRDKAYVVLAKSGKALHFREVADAINKVGWSKRKAHPQTVHNELIKDSRFVLVGRGLYALKEWGYEPGVVRDVLASVLKSAKRSLDKDEVVKLVLEKRFVKPQTILLNLQNKSLFRKTDDGRYNLA